MEPGCVAHRTHLRSHLASSDDDGPSHFAGGRSARSMQHGERAHHVAEKFRSDSHRCPGEN
jgi:hypothetical protein